jgi:hypothetical protein
MFPVYWVVPLKDAAGVPPVAGAAKAEVKSRAVTTVGGVVAGNVIVTVAVSLFTTVVVVLVAPA